jgi:auxin efflux carrier family protein
MGSVFGLIVGSIGSLRELFINGVLKSVFEAMRTLGAGYLPAVLLVLAGSLISPQPAKDDAPKAAVQPAENSRWGFVQQISVVYLCRFLLMPSLLFAIVNSLKVVYPSMYAYLQSDKLLLFILLLEACMPSAQNSVTIQQLAGDKEGANMMAKTLLAIYALGTPAITFWLMKILQFTDLSIV